MWLIKYGVSCDVAGFYGGWDLDNVNETYELDGTVGYRFKMWDVSSKVFAGYRYLYVHYDREVDIRVEIKGPLVGIGWEF